MGRNAKFLNIDFYPCKMTIHFGTPPPLKDNHRVCDHNAMLAFPQEQISHYTTDPCDRHTRKNIHIIVIPICPLCNQGILQYRILTPKKTMWVNHQVVDLT